LTAGESFCEGKWGRPLLLQLTDERILGDGDFVEDVLSAIPDYIMY
jgi:hypothetical protein